MTQMASQQQNEAYNLLKNYKDKFTVSISKIGILLVLPPA